MAKRDYYEILGVQKSVTEAEVKSAYRKLALKFHPDRNPGNKEAEDMFKEASEAYEVLSDQQKRATYDRFGHQGLSGQGFSGFQDVNDVFSNFGSIFEEFFGFSSGGGGGGARRGADLRYDLSIDFEESVFGTEREISFERAASCKKCNGSGCKPGTSKKTCGTCGGVGQVRRSQGFFSVATTCPTCRGAGQSIADPCRECDGEGLVVETKKMPVKIPAGVEEGIRLRVTGEGNAGSAGAGDLYVMLHVRESQNYRREGHNLIKLQELSLAQATLGAKLKIASLDNEHTLTIPPGTQFGDRITIAGAGVPKLRGIGRGDLIIELNIIVPKKLSKAQREAMEKFAEASGDEPVSGQGFFQKIFNSES
jgi:molecular chaperone DnaJ